MEEKRYDGQTLKQALKSAEMLLEKRVDEINALNVFPVPDGDTGINMYLTLKAANECIDDSASTSAAEISSKAAMGALMGARGNSGVIFSQIMRGLSKGLENKESFSAAEFALALQQASESAYQSMEEPVEGTILTVIRESAETAMQQAREGADLKKIITATASQARETVTRTPDLLKALREAGVVDAGGKGLFYIFQGMKNFITRNMNPVEGIRTGRRQTGLETGSCVYGYDLQFLVEGQDLPLAEMREKINTMGESVLVVGDETLVRVHIHTRYSQAVMDYCASKGRLKDIINDNMDEQVKRFHAARKGESGELQTSGNIGGNNRLRDTAVI
ncbi:MAG: DAK2 domain-containing protein [Dehalococcoidales bacterium]|nr:DAK2 domain-containing protein [Dehalococcoidales bacterium]